MNNPPHFALNYSQLRCRNVAPSRPSRSVRGPDPLSAGFTLIELLVVISIIALLIAILVPALGKARSKADSVVCQSRIKGLNTAVATYLAEFDNTFPINGLLFPKTAVPQMYKSDPRFNSQDQPKMQYWRLEYGALWTQMHGTAPDSSTTPPLPAPSPSVAKAFLCPSDTLARTYSGGGMNNPLLLQPVGGNVQVVQQPGQGGYWSYSVNSVLNSLGRFRDKFPKGIPWIDPLKQSEIQNPSNFIYFIEEGSDSLMNDEVFDPPAFGGNDHLTNRHNNGGNVGFADGHVEWFNEVVFDNGGSNPATTDAYTAMQSPTTRLFFPDGGDFAGPP